MKKYVLITFYNRGTESNQCWEVFGHIGELENDCIGTFEKEIDCVKFILRLNTPFIKGRSNDTGIQNILKRLS